MAQTAREIAVTFLNMVVNGNISRAYDQYVALDMRHHDPNFAGDARSLQKAMEENHREYPNKIMDIKRTIAEGDLVVVHSRLRIHSGDKFGMALMHIFRFENGQITELWDLGQPVEEDFPNDNGMF